MDISEQKPVTYEDVEYLLEEQFKRLYKEITYLKELQKFNNSQTTLWLRVVFWFAIGCLAGLQGLHKFGIFSWFFSFLNLCRLILSFFSEHHFKENFHWHD